MSCGPRLWYNKVGPPQSHSLAFRFKEKVNGCSKGINLRYIFRNFLRKKKLIFLMLFFYMSNVIDTNYFTTFLQTADMVLVIFK